MKLVKSAKDKKDKIWVRQQMILSAMKRVFVKSPLYKAIKDAAKVPYTAIKKDGTPSKAKRIQIRCNHCKKLFFDRKEIIDTVDKKGKHKLKKVYMIQVDHVEPVINPETGYIDINTWVERQFVGFLTWDPKKNSVKDLEGKLQVVCFYCHNVKSQQENAIRREIKKVG